MCACARDSSQRSRAVLLLSRDLSAKVATLKKAGVNMSLQLTRALRRLVTVPLYRSSVQGVRYATTSPKQDGEREKPILQDVVICGYMWLKYVCLSLQRT